MCFINAHSVAETKSVTVSALTSLSVVFSLQHIFGEQTWVEYWPTREESQTSEHRDRYIGIAELQNSLSNYGCAT